MYLRQVSDMAVLQASNTLGRLPGRVLSAPLKLQLSGQRASFMQSTPAQRRNVGGHGRLPVTDPSQPPAFSAPSEVAVGLIAGQRDQRAALGFSWHVSSSRKLLTPVHESGCQCLQAVLDPAAEDGARVWLQCKVQDGVPLAVAALRCGGAEAQPLDLILDQYTEFTVRGPAPVHVTGARTTFEGREGGKKAVLP